MTDDELEALSEKMMKGILPTFFEFAQLLTAYGLLAQENDFLRTDRQIAQEDIAILKELHVKSNPALEFEIDSRWVKKIEN